MKVIIKKAKLNDYPQPDREIFYTIRTDTDFTINPVVHRFSKRTGMPEDAVSTVLKSAYDVFIEKFVHQLGMVWKSVNISAEIHVLDTKLLEKTLLSRFSKDKVILCLDPMFGRYTQTYPNLHILGASRLYTQTMQKKIQERPGFPPLKEQLASFHIPKGQGVVLADDDIFTGDTARFMVDFLEQSGCPVEMAFFGVQMGKGELLRCPINSVWDYTRFPIKMNLAYPRDYLIGMSGLVVEQDGEIVRLPFLQPCVNTQKRLDLPPTTGWAFSWGIWEQNLAFYERVFQELQQDLQIQDMEPFAALGICTLDEKADPRTPVKEVVKSLMSRFY